MGKKSQAVILTTVRHSASKFLAVNPNKNDRLAMSAEADSPGQNWKMIPIGREYFRLVNDSHGDGKSLEAVTFAKYSLKIIESTDEKPGQLWKIQRTSN